MYAASQVQASSAPSGDLLGGLGRSSTPIPGSTSGTSSKGPFDAIIAIGVLIKGDTVHFEHIAESVSRGLMRLQLDFGVPVIFGLLVGKYLLLIPTKRESSNFILKTVLNEDQAKKRAGLTADGHNHGEDWGEAGE